MKIHTLHLPTGSNLHLVSFSEEIFTIGKFSSIVTNLSIGLFSLLSTLLVAFE